jgi:GrpB-like predicted nucleotidyltransferase (UPF0157 family)
VKRKQSTVKPGQQDAAAADTVFLCERKRLLQALGELVDGGIVEDIQHIGSTSVPGMPNEGCVDIGLSIWPFPPDHSRVRKLMRLGYLPVSGFEEGSDRRFFHSSKSIQLLFVEAGSELWTDYLLVRNYLREVPHALQTRHNFPETAEAARRRHIEIRGFAPLEIAVKELEFLCCPWYISSGWSVDLFLGRVTRVHHDIDIVIARDDQLIVQKYMVDKGWRWVTPHDNELKPWPEAMKLEIPRRQAHCHKEGRMFDFLIGEIDHGIWRFSRDLSIVRAVDRIMLRSDAGLPFMGPETVLLYKSKHASSGVRSKDTADYLAVREMLSEEQRSWLRWALIATYTTHPWIEALG